MAAHLLVLYNEPADKAHFDEHYRTTHAPLAKKMPGLRSYDLSDGTVSAQGASCYLVADLTFDSMDALRAALASPEGETAVADVPNFASGGASMLMYEATAA